MAWLAAVAGPAAPSLCFPDAWLAGRLLAHVISHRRARSGLPTIQARLFISETGPLVSCSPPQAAPRTDLHLCALRRLHLAATKPPEKRSLRSHLRPRKHSAASSVSKSRNLCTSQLCLLRLSNALPTGSHEALLPAQRVIGSRPRTCRGTRVPDRPSSDMAYLDETAAPWYIDLDKIRPVPCLSCPHLTLFAASASPRTGRVRGDHWRFRPTHGHVHQQRPST